MDDFGGFKWLTGDVNYTEHGGKWCKNVGGRRYRVIELDRGPGSASRYYVSLSEVDIDALENEEPGDDGKTPLEGALASCGYTIDPVSGDIMQPYDLETIAEKDAPHFDLVCVECAHGAGNRAPLAQLYGNNWRKLMSQAVATSNELDPRKEPEAYEAKMGEPANLLGTSVRNFMLGKIFARRR